MMQRKTFLIVVMILLLIPLMTAMGSLTGAAPGSVPKPAKPFRAIFIDQMDVATEVQDVTIEGGIFIEGKRGEGTITVPFDNIHKVVFLMQDGRLTASVSLKGGKTVD
ncbi:MAG: hypothetical protein N2Z74_03015, partial [Syntrophales bacterium]|nr:hypothetical protein [Syntrophales bacterium]